MALSLDFLKYTIRGQVFFLGLALFLVWAAAPAAAKTGAKAAIIKTTHKAAPAKSRVASSGRKARTDSGKSSPATKRKAAAAPPLVCSDSELRKKLSSRSAIVLDSRTGSVLYAHDPDRPAQPASTIKIITGLIAISSLRDNEMVKASSHAARMPSSKVNLRAGKSYVADDLINAVLLASANDASVALAEKVAGTESSFAQLMTHKAASLGATNTVCKTASGLTAEGQHSTAHDLAVVFDKAMDDQEFAERIRRTKIRTSFGQVLRNHNKALWRVDGAVGGKTGYTLAARQTYVGKFDRDDTEIIVAVMGSETMWADVSRLVEYGFARKQQMAAMNTPAGSEDDQLAMSTVPTAFKNNSLQVLTGTKKHSKL
ncbi:MAG: D-alanyl-D-alanine carboxypeptidase [Deltaproteobacteria bacterium]|nr:D-alanyl-D-alanine carboxypeptidase [Deltaproteobacteria bacterium]